jgi:hypothetical protein
VIPPLQEPAARAVLRCHPATPSTDVTGIEALASWRAGRSLELSYLLRGKVQRVALPAAATACFADRLWQHTCFEAFIADPQGGYCELNLSPSSQWAVYRFAGYRAGMTPLHLASPPHVTLQVEPDELRLTARVDLSGLAWVRDDAMLKLALCAVIEAVDGSVSYWALAHPAGKPDFHHPEGLALQLPPPPPHTKGSQ